jgi:hypothetical protein
MTQTAHFVLTLFVYGGHPGLDIVGIFVSRALGGEVFKYTALVGNRFADLEKNVRKRTSRVQCVECRTHIVTLCF